MHDADLDREGGGQKSAKYRGEGGKNGGVYAGVLFGQICRFFYGDGGLSKARQNRVQDQNL